ncbi:MAG: hypothetical protein DWQ05_07205 [Calditrichaeota bacterium]|nr:MAG: hypothetical protein DWQ05_07205 [Calditrichota bacterium]
MLKKLSIGLLFTLMGTSSVLAQFERGDKEFSLQGAFNRMSNDGGQNYTTSSTILIISAGFGRFITPHLQLGIEPVWIYVSTSYKYGSQSNSESDGTVGVALFMNYNFSSSSKYVPYFTGQYAIMDIAPEGSVGITDVSSYAFGGGVRYFVIERAAINTKMLYEIPIKDADEKYKTFSVQIGLSLIL